MADALARKLASLKEPQLRFGWFFSWLLSRPVDEAAQSLEELLQSAEHFETASPSAVFPLVAWIAGAVAPDRAVELLEQARSGAHYHLERMLQYADECSVSFGQAVRGASAPDYGAGRRLTLGERKSLARAPTRRRFDQLLDDPHPAVIEKLLANPQLTEPDVLRLVTRRPARVELQALVARSPRWLSSPRIRLGIALNPRTPLWQSVPLISSFKRQELKQVIDAEHVPKQLRHCASQHYARRPPVPERVRVHKLQ